MTKYDGRRRGNPQSDRAIVLALVIGLAAIVGMGGMLYVNSGSSQTTNGTASASSVR
jgi:hypothetical protein